MAPGVRSQAHPIPHLRWWIAALLFFSTVLNYIDRQVLSILAPQLTREFALSPVQYANILNAFLVAYTVMYLGSGLIVDRWGTRRSLAAFVGWWSMSNMLHALARNAVQLGFCRMLLGLGEPGNFMAAARVVSEWYAPKERAFVNGLVQAGASVGAVIAPPLVAWLSRAYDWRTAFVVTGAAGFVWLAVWLWLYDLPGRHPRLGDSERALVPVAAAGAGAGVAAREPAWRLLAHRQTWGLLLARFFSDPVWWFYLFWMPKFLSEQRGFTIVEIGMLAWLPYLTADLGSVAGGLLSGTLVSRGWVVLQARMAGMWPFACLMPLSLLIPGAQSNAVVLTVICIVTFAHMAWKTNMATVTNDLYPTELVGSLSGIVAFGNGLGGALFTALTGWVVEHYSYNAIFVIMGWMHPAAYVLFRWLVRGPVRVAEAAA